LSSRGFHYQEAADVLDGPSAVGVDYDEGVAQLEDDGVLSFGAARDHLGERPATSLAARGGAERRLS
jgi:hypothetical protein